MRESLKKKSQQCLKLLFTSVYIQVPPYKQLLLCVRILHQYCQAPPHNHQITTTIYHYKGTSHHGSEPPVKLKHSHNH